MQAIRGGFVAHIARRLFHLTMLAVPFVYYHFFTHIADQKTLRLLLLAFVFFIFLFEKLRIRMRLVLFGQRFHEATHLSTFAWTMLSLAVILFFAPLSFAVPIIATCALVDPLLGEMRLHQVNKKIMVTLGVFVASAIWFFCAWFYHFSGWYILLAPVAVAAEWPRLTWIDDNAMMLLIPLAMIFLSTTIL